MKRQEHLAEVEEVAIRVRVENLKNGRYLGTSPDVRGWWPKAAALPKRSKSLKASPEKSWNPAGNTAIRSPLCSGARLGRSANSAFLFLSLKWDASQDFPTGKLPAVSERLVSNWTVPVPAATKSDAIRKRGERSRFRTIPEIWRRARCARFSAKLELM